MLVYLFADFMLMSWLFVSFADMLSIRELGKKKVKDAAASRVADRQSAGKATVLTKKRPGDNTESSRATKRRDTAVPTIVSKKSTLSASPALQLGHSSCPATVPSTSFASASTVPVSSVFPVVASARQLVTPLVSTSVTTAATAITTSTPFTPRTFFASQGDDSNRHQDSPQWSSRSSGSSGSSLYQLKFQSGSPCNNPMVATKWIRDNFSRADMQVLDRESLSYLAEMQMTGLVLVSQLFDELIGHECSITDVVFFVGCWYSICH